MRRVHRLLHTTGRTAAFNAQSAQHGQSLRAGSTFDGRARTYDTPAALRKAAQYAEVIRSRPWFRSQPVGAMGDGLDFGCGTGLLSFELQPHLRTVVGVDESSGMLDVMREKIADAALETAMTATQAPLAELGSFDLVFSSLAVHHVADCAGLILELARHLRPGGRLLIVDFEATPNSRLFHRPDHFKGTHYEHDGLPYGELLGWLQGAGLEELDAVRKPWLKEIDAGWERPGHQEEFNMLFVSAAAPR